MTDERERLRSARERAERNAADMETIAKSDPRKGRYFLDPKQAGEIAEDLKGYGEILSEKEKALDESALKDAIEVYRRDPVKFLEAVGMGPTQPWQRRMLEAFAAQGAHRLTVNPDFRRELSGLWIHQGHAS